MHDWAEIIIEPGKIRAIFADRVPPLTSVDLHEVVLHRDGPSITLRFDLSTYPVTPPKKWQAQGCNRVQVQLLLTGVTDFSMRGWQRECRIDLAIHREQDRVKLVSANGPVAILIVADFVMIAALSAYCSRHEKQSGSE